jgi:hypothetical protein
MKVFVRFLGIKTLLFACLPVFISAKAAVLPAVPCTLAWNSSSDISVTGYALYYGMTGSGVTNRLDVGTAQTATLSNLTVFSNYFFYVVAYNAAGVESAPSNLLLYSPPALTRLRLSQLADGSMRIQFRAGTGVVCRVEYASTLATAQWATLASATADANGDIAIDDSVVGNSPMRFYRGVVPE